MVDLASQLIGRVKGQYIATEYKQNKSLIGTYKDVATQ